MKLSEWTDELRKAAEEVLPEARKIVQKGALNIKNDWRARWTGYAHIPDLPNAITYDTVALTTSVKARVGPDKNKRQGPLGNLIEFGSVNNAPIPGGLPALEAEEPRFLDQVADLGVRLLGGD